MVVVLEMDNKDDRNITVRWSTEFKLHLRLIGICVSDDDEGDRIGMASV